jgi:hypothetical protein
MLSKLGDAFLSVVAPGTAADLEPTFGRVLSNPALYEEAIARIQQFRGRVYREDGALPPSVLNDSGRHWSDLDYRSWHLLATDARGKIMACIRYTQIKERPINLKSLHLHQALLRANQASDGSLRAGIQAFVDRANRRGGGLSEVGGWAIRAEARNSSKAVILPCACWSFGALLGDSFGIATVTTRHHSVQILRRLGGFPLECHGAELPAFFDPLHGCALQIVAFAMPTVNPQYRRTMDEIVANLRLAPVLAA